MQNQKNHADGEDDPAYNFPANTHGFVGLMNLMVPTNKYDSHPPQKQ
jgi:hypothetical protein